MTRIPPAHAGKSVRSWTSASGCGDHPRTCGEKQIILKSGARIKGSPPHMRGKVIYALHDCAQCGITPAHAGKRIYPGSSAAHKRDHPRTCGEKSMMVPHTLALLGSPPHMRGKGCGFDTPGFYIGITPAHAGKSVFLSKLLSVVMDHPRTCGEKHRRCSTIATR